MYKSSHFSRSWPIFVILCLCWPWPASLREMVSYCGLDLPFPDDWWPSHVLTSHLYSLWGKCLLGSFGHFYTGIFVFLLLNFKSSLYVLETSALSDMLFANTFSHPVGCHLAFLVVSFELQIPLILTKSNLYFLVLLLVSYPKLQTFPPILSFCGFIVLALTFKPFIHDEFIFIYGVWEASNLILCRWISSCPNTTGWKDCSFLID